MKMSAKGISLLTKWEGFKKEVYLDAASKRTIGVGHLLTPEELISGVMLIGGEPVEWQDGLTSGQVGILLAQDLKPREEVVTRMVKVQLNQDQFDALVSFVFNVGDGAFHDSTLLKLLNQGKYDEVPTQLRRWNKAGGKVVDGLVERREKEIKLWSGQYS